MSNETSPLLGKTKSQPIIFEAESVCDTMDDEEMEAQRLREEVRQSHQDNGFLRRPSRGLLCFILALISIGDMLCMTPTLSLTMKKVCLGIVEEDQLCNPVKVQETVSTIFSNHMILGSLIGISVAGAWGQLSDRVGRVKVFAYTALITFIGNGLHLFTLLSWFPYSPIAIVISSSISFFSGGTFSLLANGYSYIADVTEPERRTESMGVVMSVNYAAMGAGPMISSLLVDLPFGTDTLPVLCGLAVTLVATILCFFTLHEPRHEQARRNSCQSDSNADSSPLDPLKQLWLPRTRSGSTEPRLTVILLLILDVLFLCVTAGSGPAFLLFFSYRYGWRSQQWGYYLSATGLGKAAVLIMLAPSVLQLLKNRYGTLSRTADRVDVLSIRFSFFTLLIGLALVFCRNQNAHMVYIYAILQAPSALCSPTIQAAIIKYCPKYATGQCFGGMALVRSCVMLIFPAFLLKVYGWSVSKKPELFLLVPVSFAFLAMMISFLLREPLAARQAADEGRQELHGRSSSWWSLAPSERAREESLAQTEVFRENYSHA